MSIFKTFTTISKKTLAVATGIALATTAIATTPARADTVLSGTLYRGEVDWIRLRDMEPGTNFRVFGTCDSDCSDIDFHLYDSNDNLVDSDTLYDDVPIVSATPRWRGNFYLKVSIPSCSTSYCGYEVYIDD